MSLPVNKKTLDTTIDNNIKANNPPNQSITAAVLHDTLAPIVNSTFGIKTIWGGWINYYQLASNNNSWKFNITENYYDPNYFPALDPNTLTPVDPSTLGQVGNRYRVTNFGSGITNGTSTTFEAFNVGTSIKGTGGSAYKAWRPAYGLTFDVKVTAGVVTGLKVNNPGSGYSWTQLTANSTAITPLVLYLNVGTGTLPEITIDLSRVISSPKKDNVGRVPFTIPVDGSSNYAFPINFHILAASNSIGKGSNIVGSAFDFFPTFQYSATPAFEFSVYDYSGTTTQIAGTPGYWAAEKYYTDSQASFDGYVEIKVPIIYQP